MDVSSFSHWGRLYFSYYTKYYTTLAEKRAGRDNYMYSIHNTHNALHSTQTGRKRLFMKVGGIHRTHANVTSVTSTYAQRILHVTTIRGTVTNYITTTVSNYLFSRCATLVEWTQLIGWSAVISAATFATLAVGDHKRSSFPPSLLQVFTSKMAIMLFSQHRPPTHCPQCSPMTR